MHNWLGRAYVPEYTSDWPMFTCALNPLMSVSFSLWVFVLPCSISCPWRFLPSHLSLSKFHFFVQSLSLANCLSASPCLPSWPSHPTYLAFFSRLVICPQVEYNSYIPRGIMNGRPLLKRLSITFECSLSLTSERHTRWAGTHKQAHTYTHQRLYLCMDAMHRWSAIFLRCSGIFSSHGPIPYFGDSLHTAVGGEERWGQFHW